MPARTVELKFDVGDEVYGIKRRSTPTQTNMVCPVCNGTGKFLRPTATILCKCPGVAGHYCEDGKVCMNVYKYRPLKFTIGYVGIVEDGVQYENEEFDGFYKEDELFTTLEAAQAECDNRNEKG